MNMLFHMCPGMGKRICTPYSGWQVWMHDSIRRPGLGSIRQHLIDCPTHQSITPWQRHEIHKPVTHHVYMYVCVYVAWVDIWIRWINGWLGGWKLPRSEGNELDTRLFHDHFSVPLCVCYMHFPGCNSQVTLTGVEIDTCSFCTDCRLPSAVWACHLSCVLARSLVASRLHAILP